MRSWFYHWRRKRRQARLIHIASRQAGRFGIGVKVNNHSFFTSRTDIGDHCNFNGMIVAGRGHVQIGRYFHSGVECRIITDVHNYDQGSRIPYGPGEDLIKNVVIEDFVWIGDRVMILGGVTLGEGCIIQAGSVVTKSVPPMAIAGGHPARVFRMRDVAHFERLKSEGLFH